METPDKPAERAYSGIRDAILSGKLSPGDHLREEPLAEMTSTSRTPVREALRRLVADGLAREENRHRYVTEFTDAEITLMFDLRARIEGFAASLCAIRIDQAGLQHLDGLIAQMDQIEASHTGAGIATFLECNTRFHNAILEQTGSDYLERMAHPMLMTPAALVHQHMNRNKISPSVSNAQHKEIYRALAAHHPEWADAAMRAHVLSSRPRDNA